MAPSRIKALKSYPKTSQYLKFDLKTILWSLTVPTYQKQSLLITIFAARGQKMKVLIVGNFIAKKWKFENFEQNRCYGPQKKAKNM